jgi:hypothetical protein
MISNSAAIRLSGDNRTAECGGHPMKNKPQDAVPPQQRPARRPDIDLAAALMDPAAHFTAPADVLGDDRLTHELKLEILCRWLYDATELSVAEEEGMGGGEPSRLATVLEALHSLTGGVDAERAAPTKHGALCAATPAAKTPQR